MWILDKIQSVLDGDILNIIWTNDLKSKRMNHIQDNVIDMTPRYNGETQNICESI